MIAQAKTLNGKELKSAIFTEFCFYVCDEQVSKTVGKA
ncbi:hypothetical protein CAMRE0001_2478 [Campylobacter rectus RM3267]|uniref:Uncharacterized protein n=1 Tax=Campylobacter rectus RM3267 TaxID=553218 RepID=B9D1X3_CAMRE|nr:hypothetical protein CAMRE0001_2478 [Campylobacter rectus RM3267]